MKITSVIIKIGHQDQANKSIFLTKNGAVICGNFKYNGRYGNKFKEYYGKILELANNKPRKGVLDVSGVVTWDARLIHDNYIVPRWQRSVSAEKIRKFANESEIKDMIEDIKPEFKRSLRAKWLKIFERSGSENKPKEAWQIL